MNNEVLIFPTGTANLASVLVGLQRAGGRPRVVEDVGELAAAAHVVLPGVGAFAAAVSEIQRRAAREVLRERIIAGRSTLAICLGMQLLCDASAESPGIAGLGILPVAAERLPDAQRVPQLGWNRVEPNMDCRLLEPGHAYFANSYCVPFAGRAWAAAETQYGRRFVSAVERDSVLACQFHPELSGAWGVRLLRRWLQNGAGRC